MSAKNSPTGKNQKVSHCNASPLEVALQTSVQRAKHKTTRRRTPEDVRAQLILIIGGTLAAVFLVVTVGITYALIFVTQPIGARAPNDAAFIDLFKTLAIFLTGSFGRVLGGNGLKSKPKPADTPTNTQGS